VLSQNRLITATVTLPSSSAAPFGWYFRFNFSLRDIEELFLERGVVVTYGTIRCWCDKFGAGFARCAKAVRRKHGSTWHGSVQLRLGWR
jgi:hypothetical protein